MCNSGLSRAVCRTLHHSYVQGSLGLQEYELIVDRLNKRLHGLPCKSHQEISPETASFTTWYASIYLEQFHLQNRKMIEWAAQTHTSLTALLLLPWSVPSL